MKMVLLKTMELNITHSSSLLGNLTTIGRVTGKERTVELRLVFYKGKFYASRRTADGNWFKNILNNPFVIIEVNGEKINGRAEMVKEGKLSRKISELKYSDRRREENRVIVEIIPL
jgi:F420H(2)-dependent quinone reductase